VTLGAVGMPVGWQHAGIGVMLVLVTELREGCHLWSCSSVIAKELWTLPGTWCQPSWLRSSKGFST